MKIIWKYIIVETAHDKLKFSIGKQRLNTERVEIVSCTANLRCNFHDYVGLSEKR